LVQRSSHRSGAATVVVAVVPARGDGNEKREEKTRVAAKRSCSLMLRFRLPLLSLRSAFERSFLPNRRCRCWKLSHGA
ncbi:unnamed protein product, partial [Musa banksii]